MRTHKLFFGSFSLLLALGLGACDKSDGATEQPDGAPKATEPVVDAGPAFENPGGMWMPTQMADHGETLKKLGLEYDPAALTDPTKFPLNAIVSLGFCSGSFVSDNGLIVTNHHCAVPVALQHNSTPEKNLINDGYLAKEMGDELWAGPGQKIYVTTGYREVTDEVYAGTADITDDTARYEKIQDNREKIDDACEEKHADTRCVVRGFFEGAEYYEIRQLEIRDVRLVYAPHAGVGVFGGEIDNWRWPRHTGDFSFLRAYVGKDGKPADFSKDNVPYKPSSFLKPASSPLEAGDLVMVAGYPGRTNRFKTADEVRTATDWYYPYAIQRFEENLEVMHKLAKEDKELAIKLNRSIRGMSNYLTNNKGMLDGLAKGGLADVRAGEETKLREWINADEARKGKYGGVLDEIAKLNAEEAKTRAHDAHLGEIVRASSLLSRAVGLVELADAKAIKKDAERPSGMRKEDWPKMKERVDKSTKDFSDKAERAMLTLAVRRAARLGDADRPKIVDAILGDKVTDDQATVRKAVDALYDKTKLADAKAVKKMIDKINPKAVAKSKDPMIKLGRDLAPILDASDNKNKATAGAMAKLRPTYVAALREFAGKPMAPDANSTLRVTYGTVRGYKPTPDADMYTPFTKLSEMVAKHTGAEPFAAPEGVLAAAKAEKFGSYVAEEIGEVPVDFLADLDITGGNSGSACINARGEIVGLAFDGNYEAMASDWIFMPEITRSIQVDFRYVTWIMDAVDGADRLLTEMGITPSID